MKRNSISFVIALMVVIAMAGGAQAAVAPWGDVDTSADTSAVGETVEVWLDNDPSDYVTVSVLDGSTNSDYWYVSDLTNMLDRNLYNSGDTNISATAVMYCSGTQRDIDGVNGSSYANTYENVTLVQFTVDYADGSYQAPMMNLTT
jgi:hypothetical protein